MYTEGVLLEDLLAKHELSDFEDNLFCVHLQRQYSASKELEEFIEANNIDPAIKIRDKSTLKILNALKVIKFDHFCCVTFVFKCDFGCCCSNLKRGKKNEDKLNERYLQTKTGHPILFGDIIQVAIFHLMF